MSEDWQEREKKAEHFYELFVTKEEIWNCGENEGRKVVIEIGNQFDESHGGSCIDFITTTEMDWIDPKDRFKIILCAETAKALRDHIDMALTEIGFKEEP